MKRFTYSSRAGLWQVMTSSIEAATRDGSPVIGTPHLFVGMLSTDNGPLNMGLRRFGIDSAVVRHVFDGDPTEGTQSGKNNFSGNVPCSSNTSKILLLAQANATADNRENVSEEDLLVAFVRQGGERRGNGSAGEGLSQNC
jgi:ATP-dependent Clp protease ATP-binding subunit ClpA